MTVVENVLVTSQALMLLLLLIITVIVLALVASSMSRATIRHVEYCAGPQLYTDVKESRDVTSKFKTAVRDHMSQSGAKLSNMGEVLTNAQQQTCSRLSSHGALDWVRCCPYTLNTKSCTTTGSKSKPDDQPQSYYWAYVLDPLLLDETPVKADTYQNPLQTNNPKYKLWLRITWH